jgi:hypothetical protein
MLLNARKVHRPGNNTHQILLAIEDVTERVNLERERSLAHDRNLAGARRCVTYLSCGSHSRQNA